MCLDVCVYLSVSVNLSVSHVCACVSVSLSGSRVRACVSVLHVSVCVHQCLDGKEPSGISFLILPCESQRLNLGYQARQQEPFTY